MNKKQMITTAPQHIFSFSSSAKPERIFRQDTRPTESSVTPDEMLRILNEIAQIGKIDFFGKAAAVSGGAVIVDAQHSFLPVLIDRHEQVIPLYEFVGSLDGILDYDDIIEEYPTLSYAQIAGALAFLRRLAQFNTKNIDIDEAEDEALENSAEFRDRITQSLKDTEGIVVRASE